MANLNTNIDFDIESRSSKEGITFFSPLLNISARMYVTLEDQNSNVISVTNQSKKKIDSIDFSMNLIY